MTKEEFYKEIIRVQKETGQGLSGIVKVMGIDSFNFSRWLDEFIEEGLVKVCETGGSLGDPESNRYYMPTKGYNVWEDEGTDGVYNRHKGRYLTFVRLYLGAMDKDPKEGRNENHKWLHPSMVDCVQNSEFMGEYSKWLTRNEKALEEMVNLDDFYKAAKVEFSQEELDWIKSKEWYKKNKTISDCIKSSNKGMDDDMERISINKQLVNLYKDPKVSSKYVSDLEKSLGEIKEDEKSITTRKKLQNWFDTQDKKLNIQDVI